MARSREVYFNTPLAVEAEISVASKVYVLVIYDISDGQRRLRLAKLLQGYGERVQLSAFEAMLTKQQLHRMCERLAKLVRDGDQVRVYRIRGEGAVTIYGPGELPSADDFIII